MNRYHPGFVLDRTRHWDIRNSQTGERIEIKQQKDLQWLDLKKMSELVIVEICSDLLSLERLDLKYLFVLKNKHNQIDYAFSVDYLFILMYLMEVEGYEKDDFLSIYSTSHKKEQRKFPFYVRRFHSWLKSNFQCTK